MSEPTIPSPESRDEEFTVLGAFDHIGQGVATRMLTAASKLHYSLLAAVVWLPVVSADYTSLSNKTDSNYDSFVPENSSSPKVIADINNFASPLRYNVWQERAQEIRRGNSMDQCIGNLSVALEGLGAAYAASSSGASTLLTLIPTAGALIGAPAKELWVLYKLMPIAGVLSMMLSLGGNIVPMNVNDYEVDAFSYSGMIATAADQKVTHTLPDITGETEAERFASMVYMRAIDTRGARRSVHIWLGIALQTMFLLCIMFACYFLESGSIVVWWCNNAAWMYFWYALVAASSLTENLAGVPFTQQWTIRVSKAPKVEIDEDAPWVISEPLDPSGYSSLSGAQSFAHDLRGSDIPLDDMTPLEAGNYQFAGTSRNSPYSIERKPVSSPITRMPTRLQHIQEDVDILTGLERGYNTIGRVVIDRTKPWSASNDPFYVLLSVKGVSTLHAISRVISKFLSVGTFAIGTCLFASSTLVTIIVALITASFILCAGIFGRVTAMWMASEMMKNRPVLHRVVQTRQEAAKYMDAILRKKGMICEVLGHVIVDGRCVKKFGKRIRWSSWLGVLASPYDLNRLAMNPVA